MTIRRMCVDLRTPTVSPLVGNMLPVLELPRQKDKAAYSTEALGLLDMTEWFLISLHPLLWKLRAISNAIGRPVI